MHEELLMSTEETFSSLGYFTQQWFRRHQFPHPMGMVIFIFVRAAPFAEIIYIQRITGFFYVPGNLKGGAMIIAIAGAIKKSNFYIQFFFTNGPE